jgi:two-component system CheB/CheR fusion protein
MAAPKKNQKKSQPPATLQNFPIVGIGASAGGLDAFKRLLTAIPENSGMAYVLVQHLDPNHDSILPEILQRVTKIPVHEITDDIHLAPDHIYIIPSNKILTSTDGVLQLSPRETKINLTIDIFFTTLADVHKECAIGIVLSGTGSDGTLGLKAIKEHGGISIVQDSESATYDSMPQSAVNAGVVDFILAPEEIPAHLLLINSAYKTGHVFKPEEEELPKDDETIFKQILLLLRQRSGVDFTYYKQPTFHRRIARRIAITKKKNLAEYLRFLRSDKAEQDALFLDVLIPVTSFFRDPKTFKALTTTVFPAILKNKVAGQPIRIWIAGCSTGEEAFSIAICLQEYLTLNLSRREGTKIQIFASDISDRAIKKARAAVYTKADIEKLSEIQIKNYFVKNNDNYEVTKLIRDMCVFAPHNFLKDPPFARMDLITCRNVLIYMDTFLQKKAFTTFHYALKENGFLLLGKSETTGVSSDLFTQVSKQDKIYSRKSLQGRFMPLATEPAYRSGGRDEERFTTPDMPAGLSGRAVTRQESVHTDFRRSAEEIMISKSPASVVVNETMDIVHIHGDITPFLQAPQGKPTHNLIKMAREGLAFELRNTIHKARKEQAAVTKENIPVKINAHLNDDGEQEKQSLVAIEIIPLTDTIEPHYLIRFEKKIIPVVEDEKKSSSGKIIETQKQNHQLERELSQTREDMRSITEDMEAANEELQSANEELQSSNEEMQSLNEELETSKEELQSTNEELIIVNQELLDKQEQLNSSIAEQSAARKQVEASEKRFSNILSQSLLAIAILKGPEMIISSANDTIIDIWGKGRNVIGKRIIEVLPEIEDQEFPKLLMDVYKTGTHFVASEIKCILNRAGKEEECYFNLIYQPYTEADNTITGITMLATEVTKQVMAKKQIEASDAFNRSIINSSPDCLKILDQQGKIQYVNSNGMCLMGIDDLANITNKYWWTLWGPENELLVKQSVNKALRGETAHFTALCPTASGALKWWDVMVSPVGGPGEPVEQIIAVSRDITELKKSEEVIEKMAAQLKLATDSANVGIWTLDIVSSKLEWSGKLKKMWGYDENVENLTFEDWATLILPEDRELTFQKIEESKKNHTIYDAEYRIKRANDGAILWMKSTGQYQYDDFGEATTLTGINLDITEQKTIDNELLEAKSKAENDKETAENAVIAKQQFLSNMSHEIRTPMNAIIGFTKVLMKTDLSEKQKEYLRAIKSSGNTLIVLIDDILDLAKVDAGKMIFVNAPFKIVESITTILHLFETKIEEKNLELVKEFDSKIPELVNGDSVRLNQILINLLGNAIKFTSNGKIKVSVNLLKEDKQKVKIEIKVSDTGIGIPQNKIATIFENFEQAHTITSSLYGGTGLGLAIVKQLVEKQGGTIAVKSKVNEGTTFSFVLSFQKNRINPDNAPEDDGELEFDSEIKDLKVLVVEDVKLNQLLMRTILDEFKFEWDIADNGQIAIEKLETNSYDIILMDLQMPVMNGFETTKHIRKKMNSQIPIIALTADVTTVDVEKCRAAGMNDYISKPVDEKLLYGKIVDLMKSK